MGKYLYVICWCLLAFSSQVLGDGWDPNTSAPNRDSIQFTRHNLTMSYTSAAGIMANIRNNYFEVCVYCHTPHGSNSKVDGPLWNRSLQFNYTSYNTYNQTTTHDQNVSQPGPNSLTCLTCHDGAVSIDSIINMPTRRDGNLAGYNVNMEQVPIGGSSPGDSQFLDSWSGATEQQGHATLSPPGGGPACLTCHNGVSAPNFLVFQIAEKGSNLTNDHPIGVTFPLSADNPDYHQPTGTGVDGLGRQLAFFDNSRTGKPNHLDKDEIRLYNSGDGPEVECASCHDPHGVPSEGAGSEFIPSFLRVSNQGSKLCLTCHIK